jgi:hypothetical protein
MELRLRANRAFLRFALSKNILGNLEMFPTQAKRRLEWATHHFHPLRPVTSPAKAKLTGGLEAAKRFIGFEREGPQFLA